MISALISAVLQLAVVLLIAAGVWIASRRPEPFRRFLGLTVAPVPVLLVAMILAAVAAVLITSLPAVRELAAGGAVAGAGAAGEPAGQLVVILALRALIQTSLSEELLFRGLIGRNLIRRWGFTAGNLVQATLFGLFHLILLLAPGATAGAVAILVVSTGLVGWILGWANERFASGSILPGWAAHGAANLAAYHLLAFGA